MRGFASILGTTVLVLLARATPACGQSDEAREELRRGLEQAAAGDTAAALTYLDRAVRLDPRLAEAHFRRGLLHARQASAKATEYADRLEARQAFEEALRWDPDNPLYLLELGRLMLMQQVRVDAGRLFQRALDAASRADAHTLAEVHYQLALLRETQWLRFRYRHNLPIGLSQLNADFAFADPRYVWRLLDHSNFIEGQGAGERDEMLRHLHAALAADPSHGGSATHLLAYYYDDRLMDEYLALARQLVRAASTEPKAYFALGLGLHAVGREDEAAGSFRYGLELMPAREREQVQSVGRLLTRAEAEKLEARTPEVQVAHRRRFWLASDPLLLTSANEFWLEYMARMAYADLRFGLPEYELRGWDTDRGIIWVRYGPPARMATFAPSVSDPGDFEAIGRITTVWAYAETGPVFVFRQNPGYRLARFANDFRFYAEDYRSVQPTRFTAPSLPSLALARMQVVRFRGPDRAMDLEIHARLPLDSIGSVARVGTAILDEGLFVLNAQGLEIARVVDRRDVELRALREEQTLRSWRTSVPAGKPYLVSVEAREPLSGAAAVARENVGAKSFPPGEPSVSDLLLATELEPLRQEPEGRHDFRIVPQPVMTFRASEPIGLYFELYNLVPDADAYASYELELVVSLQEIYRRGPVRQILGELADKWGFTPEGGQAVRLRFQKEARVLARDLVPEYFTISLADAPAGRYGLELAVLDRNAGLKVTTARTFEIVEP
ncbi:MAG: GWxTD domain-containing protein [Gemmatimonadetes bacterium]|nr:GWxTD domain-containing protein [Gemmatimonadota bacterium]